MEHKFNIVEAHKYIINTRKKHVSEQFVRKVYDKIRKYIYCIMF